MRKEALLLILAIALSAILHAPAEAQAALLRREAYRPLYNDLISVFHYSVFSTKFCASPPDTWVNRDLMKRVICEGGPGYVIPVRDFKVTAPPLPTLWFALASSIARGIAGSYLSRNYVLALYLIQVISSAAGILAGYSLAKRALGGRRIYPLFLISAIAYGVYYWDFIALPLIMWGLYLAGKGEKGKALLSFALASLSDFFWIFIIPVYLAMIRDEELSNRDLALALSGLSPLVALIALNPQYYSWIIDSALTSGLNNSVYVLLTRFADSTHLARLAGGLWISALVVLVAIAPRPFDKQVAAEYLALSAIILYIISKASLPQTLIVIAPLLSPLCAARERRALLAAEALNASFLPLFLYIGAIVEYLSQLGIRASAAWYSLDSPVQWAIQARNIALIYVAIALIRRSRALARILER